jgi:hypothetical protein
MKYAHIVFGWIMICVGLWICVSAGRAFLVATRFGGLKTYEVFIMGIMAGICIILCGCGIYMIYFAIKILRLKK